MMLYMDDRYRYMMWFTRMLEVYGYTKIDMTDRNIRMHDDLYGQYGYNNV